jgi:DNA-binding NtrC family response regulator
MTDPLPPSVASPLPDDTLVGASRAMREVKQYLPKVAAADCNVLITGETGTGKERVAAWIHRHSRRAARPLVSINCAAIPDGLLESELFGFERGAFTGAHTAYAGKLRQAEGGTLFFDEIGDMSPSAQAKILRAIEAKEVCQLGGRRNVPSTCASWRPPTRTWRRWWPISASQGSLLSARRRAHPLAAPARAAEDIPLIFEHCLAEMNVRSGRHVGAPSREALTCLLTHAWPGNVRELRKPARGDLHQPAGRRHFARRSAAAISRTRRGLGSRKNSECERLLAALFAVDWNKSKAAAALHWSRMTLYRKMAKYHIEREAAPQEGRRLAGKSSRQGRAL